MNRVLLSQFKPAPKVPNLKIMNKTCPKCTEIFPPNKRNDFYLPIKKCKNEHLDKWDWMMKNIAESDEEIENEENEEIENEENEEIENEENEATGFDQEKMTKLTEEYDALKIRFLSTDYAASVSELRAKLQERH